NPGPDTLTTTRALIRAVQDARASVRFFRNSFSNGNPYGIDTSMIFFGGTSTGGMIALHLAYLDRMSDFPLWCDTTKTGMGGGLQGLSGHPFYGATTTPIPSTVKAVISICGAITDTSWIHAGGIPAICFHGDSDKTIPYNHGPMVFQSTYKVQYVYGGDAVRYRALHQGMRICMKEYIGQDHLPEVNPFGTGPAFLDTTLNMTRNLLVSFTCGDAFTCYYHNPFVLGVKEQTEALAIHCYPNPAGSFLTVDMGETEGMGSELTLYGMMGQELRHYTNLHASVFTLERGNLAPGLYLLSLTRNGKRIQMRIIFN
ncbi:MAG TPA: T9SS type A sorting domain-containing protein, partial [Bacteroidia bacterium]|nr:T9SS type A sorting domain-containing protein [Bacteroidia bacterium]